MSDSKALLIPTPKGMLLITTDLTNRNVDDFAAAKDVLEEQTGWTWAIMNIPSEVEIATNEQIEQLRAILEDKSGIS